MSDEQLRIGDAEREHATAALGEHFAQGRITAEEHAERLDQIWAARTRADLQPVFRDLPDPARRTTSPARSRDRRAGRGGPPRLLLAVLAVLIVLTVLTHLPFVVAGLLVAIFVFSRRRHRIAAAHGMQHWPR
jgi:ferric-dicitrate binding protein FerR (iron transport regulator)